MNSDRIRNAISELYDQGKRYVSTLEVADQLDEDPTKGELSAIGATLSELDNVEKWSKNRNTTWQLKGGGSA